MRRFLLVVVLGLVVAPARGASILVDNSPPDNVTAYFSDTGFSQYLANSFTLGSSATVTGVNFWGVFTSGGPTSTFTVNLFANSAGHPGSLLSTSSATLTGTPNGGATGGFQDYLFQSTFAGVPLSAGTYWLSVYDTSPASSFAWSTHSQTGSFDFATASPTTGPWTTFNGGTLTFQILGPDPVAVPEPSTVFMALTASVAGMVAYRRRKRVA